MAKGGIPLWMQGKWNGRALAGCGVLQSNEGVFDPADSEEAWAPVELLPVEFFVQELDVLLGKRHSLSLHRAPIQAVWLDYLPVSKWVDRVGGSRWVREGRKTWVEQVWREWNE